MENSFLTSKAFKNLVFAVGGLLIIFLGIKLLNNIINKDKIDNDILNYIMNIIYHIIKSYDKNNKLLKEKINLSF